MPITQFLHINHEGVRARLRDAGAICEKPMRLMRRVTFDGVAMKAKNGWVRVRDEGDRVTIAYKQTDSLDIDGTKEIETTVGDFEAAVAIFKQLEITGGSFQESRRETWRLGEVQIELDSWPWLDDYIEIEASSTILVHDVAESLGFDMKDAVSGDVMVAYRDQYPHLGLHDTVGNLAEVRFGIPLPDLLKKV